MPHPATHSREDHHNWLDRLIHDPKTDILMAVSVLTSFAVSLHHPTEEGRKIASKVTTAMSTGWTAAKAFDTYFGHHFKD